MNELLCLPSVSDAQLDLGLRAVFRHLTPAPASDSIVGRLESNGHTVAPTRLGRFGFGPPASSATATDLLDDPRLELVDEIARGGMGIVLRARDRDLGREVAVKTLRPEARRHPELVERFIEEARLAGQLEHPGIAPVYRLGVDAQRRPYIAMKLIDGETLTQRLRTESTERDLSHLLPLFEQICEVVAFAHERNVIHRDLKPDNIMVGSFGEVQVMDWGFGKRAAVDPAGVPDPELPSSEHDSIAGTVMGTPGYMSPEQARGEVEQLDARTDVFALGSILCQLLTGEPAFVGDAPARCRQAVEGDLGCARGRLARCDEESSLVALTLRCLEADASDRPANAAELVRTLSDRRSQQEERTRVAALEAIEARHRDEQLAEELRLERWRTASARRARRRSAVIAIVTVICVAALAGGFLWTESERTQREGEVTQRASERLEEASRLRGARDWRAARASARTALQLAREAGVPSDLRLASEDLVSKLDATIAASEAAIERDERCERLLEDLDLVRFTLEATGDRNRAIADYRAAFRASGFEEIDRRIGDELADATDAVTLARRVEEWALLLRNSEQPDETAPPAFPGVAPLLDLAARLDPSTSRAQLREAIFSEDTTALDPFLETVDTMSADAVALLGLALRERKAYASAVDVLTHGVERFPGHYLLRSQLAQSLRRVKPGRSDEAIVQYQAAMAAGLDGPLVLGRVGFALQAVDRYSEAERFLLRAVGAAPDRLMFRYELGNAVLGQGRIDEARAIFQDLHDRDPNFALSEIGLADCLYREDRFEEALAWYQTVSDEIGQNNVKVGQIGLCLRQLGRSEEAIPHLRRAVEIDPFLPNGWTNLGNAYAAVENYVEAEACHREAIRHVPSYASAHYNLGHCLVMQRKFDPAAKALRDCLRWNPSHLKAQHQLGVIALRSRDYRSAVRWFRSVLEQDPDHAVVRSNLGIGLYRLRDYEAAIEVLQESTKRAARSSDHRTLANSLGRLGRWPEAVEVLEAWIALSSEDHRALGLLGNAYLELDDPLRASHAYRRATEIDDRYFRAHNGLGNALLHLGDRAGAIASFERVVELKPGLIAWRGLANALLLDGRAEAAISWYARALEAEPNFVADHLRIATAYQQRQSWDHSRYHLQTALDLAPDQARVHTGWGDHHRLRGQWPEASAAYERAIAAGDTRLRTHYHWVIALHANGEAERALEVFQSTEPVEPSTLDARTRSVRAEIERRLLGADAEAKP